MRNILLVVVLFSLACAGLDSVEPVAPVAPSQPDEPEPAAEPTEAPAETDAPAQGPVAIEPVDTARAQPGVPTLLVLDPRDGCTWELRTADGPVGVLFRTPECPAHLRLSPDGSELVAASEQHVWHGSLTGLTQLAAPGTAERLWVVGGKPVISLLHFGEGEVAKRTYTLEGTAWKEASEPVPADMLDMGDPLVAPDGHAKDWVPLKFGRAPSTGADLGSPAQTARAAVGADQDQLEVGQLPVGERFLTWAVDFGDSLHPVPPVVWCPDAACTSSTALTGDLPSQLDLHPWGDLVLITEEYSGEQPALYRVGAADPIWTGPQGSAAMWWPHGP